METQYQDLGGPTPFNYTVDSHQIDLEGLVYFPEKIQTLRYLFRKRKEEREQEKMKEELSFTGDVLVEKKKKKTGKKVRIKNNKGDLIDIELPSENTPDQDENLIQVGGFAGYEEETFLGLKNLEEFLLDAYYSFFIHEEKKKNQPSSEKRKKKIKRLSQDSSHWTGLN